MDTSEGERERERRQVKRDIGRKRKRDIEDKQETENVGISGRDENIDSCDFDTASA